MASDKLTGKEDAFCREYLVDLNATRAAIRAGYSGKRAAPTACELLQKDKIQARLAELRADIASAAGITPLTLALELKKLALANMKDYSDWDNARVTLKDSVLVDGAAVAEVSETTTANGGTVRIKLHDKLGAIQQLTKLLGFNAPEKAEVKHTGKVEMGVSVEEFRDKSPDERRRLIDEALRAPDPGE
jgi:phage terminase small subunit